MDAWNQEKEEEEEEEEEEEKWMLIGVPSALDNDSYKHDES